VNVRRWLSALLLAALPALATAAGEVLHVSDAWVREAPPGASVLAGYMKVSNPGTETVRVSGISGADFSSIEIHRTVIENGMARMIAIDHFDVPPGESFVLEPGGYHLMLFNPVRALDSGDRVELLLHVSDGPCLPVAAPVMRLSDR